MRFQQRTRRVRANMSQRSPNNLLTCSLVLFLQISSRPLLTQAPLASTQPPSSQYSQAVPPSSSRASRYTAPLLRVFRKMICVIRSGFWGVPLGTRDFGDWSSKRSTSLGRLSMVDRRVPRASGCLPCYIMLILDVFKSSEWIVKAWKASWSRRRDLASRRSVVAHENTNRSHSS